MKKKILTLQPDLPNEGGVGRVVFSLKSEFEKSNIENDVFVIKFYDSFILSIIKKLMKKKTINSKKNKDENVIFIRQSVISKILGTKIYKKKITKKISNKTDINKYDIIHAHSYSVTGFFTKYICEKYKKKSVLTFHGSDTLHLNRKDEKTIKKFDYVTYVSGFLKQVVHEKINLKNVNETIIYNGIDTNSFKLLNDDNYQRKTIIYVGRLEKIKGVESLKKIFTEVSKIDKNIEFHIYGDGEKKNELQCFFDNVKTTVKFYGTLTTDDLVKKMQQAKILVLPSEREGFPCVVQEAKSCGVYVIATDVGGTAEAIGEIGDLIKRENDFEAEFIKKIKDIYFNKKIKSSSIATDNINSWKKIAKEYVDIYSIILDL